MSLENAEIVRQVLEAATGADRIKHMVEHFDPDVVWETDPNAPEPGTYHGRDSVRTYLEGLSQGFGELRFEIHEMIDLGGNHLLAITTAHGSGGLSGADVELTWCFLAEARDSKLVRIRSFLDRDAAFHAAGLAG
jgi:ketosteroid isomerase-like protein